MNVERALCGHVTLFLFENGVCRLPCAPRAGQSSLLDGKSVHVSILHCLFFLDARCLSFMQCTVCYNKLLKVDVTFLLF